MADAGEDPTLFTAHSLPSDRRLWASVTNAYLGTRVYHDTLHVSGIYNGALGDTHRAVLPSPLNIQLEAPVGTGEQLTKTFVLDTNTGSHRLSQPHPQPLFQVSGGPTATPPWHRLTQPSRPRERRPREGSGASGRTRPVVPVQLQLLAQGRRAAEVGPPH